MFFSIFHNKLIRENNYSSEACTICWAEYFSFILWSLAWSVLTKSLSLPDGLTSTLKNLNICLNFSGSLETTKMLFDKEEREQNIIRKRVIIILGKTKKGFIFFSYYTEIRKVPPRSKSTLNFIKSFIGEFISVFGGISFGSSGFAWCLSSLCIWNSWTGAIFFELCILAYPPMMN